MNIKELTAIISMETKVPKWAVGLVLKHLTNNMARFIVEHKTVKLRGVGTWGVRVRGATTYIVPTVQGEVHKPEELTVFFDVSKHLTRQVRQMASVKDYHDAK